MSYESKIFREKASELNCEAVITDALNNDALQRQQANELIRSGVDVLVLMAVNTNTAAKIVRDAHNANVKVIAYDRLINNCDLDFYISHNNYNVGKIMGDYVTKIRPKGKYILIGGDKSDRNAILVKTGQLDALSPLVKSGDIEILYDVYIEDWSQENACFETMKFLKLSAGVLPDAILTSYDGLARGARQAIDRSGITANIIITGQDAETQAIKDIIAGKQTLTVYKPLKPLAENAVITALKLAKGEKAACTCKTFNNKANVPSLLFEPVAVDKNNIRETVIKDGMITESEIGLHTLLP